MYFDTHLDGCVIDVLGKPGSTLWSRVVGMYDATEVEGLVGKFRCAPMFDMTGSSISVATVSEFVNMISLLCAKPSALKRNGRFEITWFAPERKVNAVGVAAARTFYQDILNGAEAAGYPCDFTMCYVANLFGTTTAAALDPVATRHARWGLRNPEATGSTVVDARGAAQKIWDLYAKPYMGNVSPGDVRANLQTGNNWNEQRGTEQFVVSWDAALYGNHTARGSSEWYQVITWNDWSETANMCPSRNVGWSLCDLNRYFNAIAKTGITPPTLRDCIFLAHKTQFTVSGSATTFTGEFFNNPMEHVGATDPADIIDLFVFCKDPTNVVVDVTTGGVTTTRTSLVKGANRWTVPLREGAAGSVTAVMRRNGVSVPGTRITSPWRVTKTAEAHDPSYRIGNSLRGWSPTYPDIIPSQASVSVVWRTAGATTSTSTTVACRTSGNSSVRVRLRRADGTGSAIYSELVTPGAHGESKHVFTGLSPGTEYLYAVEGDTKLGPEDGRVRTFASTGTFTFAVSSCQEINSNAAVGATIAARNPNLVVHLGDMHYRDPISTVDADIAGFWDVPLRSSNYRKMFGAGSLSYIWSDHDSGPDNNTAMTSPARSTLARVYRKLFPHYPLPASDNTGVYHTFALTDRVRFIMTDCRTYKSAQSATDDANKTVLGATQKQWLKDTVNAAPSGTVFFVAFDIAGWVGTTANTGGDDWRSYFTERTELANFMKTSGKRFYVLVGDSHSEAYDNGTNSAHGGPLAMCSPLDQVNPGGGGSKPWTVGPVPPPGDYGTTRFHQFGWFELTDTGSGSITVKFTGINGAGTTIIPTQTDLL